MTDTIRLKKRCLPQMIPSLYANIETIGRGLFKLSRHITRVARRQRSTPDGWKLVWGIGQCHRGQFFLSMHRSCPKELMCQMSKVYLNLYRNCNQFPKPKCRLWGQGQGQNFGTHGKVLPQGMCIANIKVVPESVWELRSNFRNLNTDSEVKVNVKWVK